MRLTALTYVAMDLQRLSAQSTRNVTAGAAHRPARWQLQQRPPRLREESDGRTTAATRGKWGASARWRRCGSTGSAGHWKSRPANVRAAQCGGIERACSPFRIRPIQRQNPSGRAPRISWPARMGSPPQSRGDRWGASVCWRRCGCGGPDLDRRRFPASGSLGDLDPPSLCPLLRGWWRPVPPGRPGEVDGACGPLAP